MLVGVVSITLEVVISCMFGGGVRGCGQSPHVVLLLLVNLHQLSLEVVSDSEVEVSLKKTIQYDNYSSRVALFELLVWPHREEIMKARLY